MPDPEPRAYDQGQELAFKRGPFGSADWFGDELSIDLFRHLFFKRN